MPYDELDVGVREQIASGYALDAFEMRLDRDSSLGGLLSAGPWFASGSGAFDLFTAEEQVIAIEVDAADPGYTVRRGSSDARVRAMTDVPDAAGILGTAPAEAGRLFTRIEGSLRAGIAAHDEAASTFDREQRRLTRNMDALTDGLERLARVYGKHVTLANEDPETFGGGHMVFYPMEHSNARFAIEERYTGSDWEDPERLPTSWAWRAERRSRRPDSIYDWHVSARGAVESDDVTTLLRHAEIWARHTRDIAIRGDAYRRSRPGRTRPEGPTL